MTFWEKSIPVLKYMFNPQVDKKLKLYPNYIFLLAK